MAQVVIDSGAETVDGGGGGTQPSPWNVGDDLIVGDTAIGILNIFNGGDVTSDSGTLGNTATGNGSVGVTGVGSTWTVVDRIWVGYEGTGTLTISDNAIVSSAIGNIGGLAGSTGNVTVTDTGSQWNMTSALTVGYGGAGDLTISNGGAVSSNGFYAGNDAGIHGEATVTGAGSSLNIGGSFFFIGRFGTGVLNIDDSGTVTVTSSSNQVASTVGSTGTINVTNGGVFDFSAPGFFTIGSRGDGALNVTNGIVHAGSSTTLGTQQGATGSVSLSGASASWDGGGITAGSSGTGTISVTNGATMSTGTLNLGLSGTGSGTLTIDNASVAAGSEVHVGYSGTGQMLIQNGGTLTSGTTFTSNIGYGASASGTVTVTGAGSSWSEASNLSVGREGTGTLNVLDSANVSVGSELLVGDMAGGIGTVTVDAATMTAGNILVGNAGTGTMTISGGSTVTADDFIVGNATGSNGTATVTGSSSSLGLAVELNVGLEGTGTLNVTNGGNILAADGVRVGNLSAGMGTINIDGINSEITNNANTWIGDNGTGTIALTNGADFYADLVTYIGEAATATGALTLDGSGTYWENGGDFFVGFSGSSSVSVTNGADVVGDYVSFGRNLDGSATVVVDGAGSTWTNTGDLYVGEQGTADLTISNGATVSNSAAYIGYDNNAVGTVTVDGAGSTWTNGTNVYVGEDGTGTLTIANGGTVSIGGLSTLHLGHVAGSTGTLNIGAASGDAAVAAGTLSAASVAFGTGTGLIVFNHTGTNYQFDAAISGNGIVAAYSGETILTGANTHTGGTWVYGGLLTVNGSLAGTVYVAGGTIGGSGTVGDIAVQVGSVAPGNSVGTLNTTSMIVGPGTSYDVELNDGGFVAGTNNDLINATGTVTIGGGTVNVSPENGTDSGTSYTLGTYTIITAAGGVTGTYDSVSDGFVFLDFTLSYDANNVYLTSQQGAYFTDISQTPNQTATAGAMEALGSGNTVFDALVGIVGSDATARAALDDLSGVMHPSIQTALIEDSRLLRNAINDRIRSAFDNVASGSVMVATHGGPANAQPVAGEGFTIWGQTLGTIGSWDSDGNASTLNRIAGGILMGADQAITESVRLGILAGYSRSSVDVNARNSTGTVDGYHLGAYGGSQFGAIALRGGGSFSWNNIDTSRTVAFGAFSENLSANYSAHSFQAFGEAGYSVELEQVHVEPYVGLAYVHLSTDGFTETGGASALSVSAAQTSAAYTTFGVRGETEVEFAPTRTARLSGGLAWRHAFGDVTPQTTMAFAGGAPFSIAGVPIAQNVVVMELGAGFLLNPASKLGFAYSGQIGSGLAEHGLKAELAISF